MVAPTAAAPISQASRTVPKKIWSNLLGKVSSSLWLIFHDEGNFVRVLAADRPQHAERGSDGVTAALDGQLDDILTVEIVGIFRKAGASRVLDTLVDGKNGKVTRAIPPVAGAHALKVRP